jgi:RNA polymerase sigma factor (sigma-70 family)
VNEASLSSDPFRCRRPTIEKVARKWPGEVGRREAPPPEQLVALAARAAAGDTADTARLLRLVAPQMLRVVRGVVGRDSADTDDAMQGALIAFVRALPDFRGECGPAGYACRIAFRSALALRKSARLEGIRRGDEDLDTLCDAQASVSDWEAHRRRELTRRLLEELPTEQAEALALRTMLGWSIQEIAEASGAPINTVRSRLRLAKEAARQRIQADPKLAEWLEVGS